MLSVSGTSSAVRFRNVVVKANVSTLHGFCICPPAPLETQGKVRSLSQPTTIGSNRTETVTKRAAKGSRGHGDLFIGTHSAHTMPFLLTFLG